MNRKLLSFDPAELRRLYIDLNMSTVEIAEQFGCNAQSVSNHLKKHGIPRKPQVNRKDRPHPNKARKMEQNGFWNGGRTVDRDGYVLVKRNDHPGANRLGYVREHRLVMEEKIGRPLLRSEVVHHLNGNVADNRPENLEVFGSNEEHLAKTLLGRCPKWTEEGYANMLRSAQRKATIAAATLAALESYALEHQTTVSRLRKLLSKEDTRLLKMAVVLGRRESLEVLRKERETIRRDWLALRLSARCSSVDRKSEYLP